MSLDKSYFVTYAGGSNGRNDENDSFEGPANAKRLTGSTEGKKELHMKLTCEARDRLGEPIENRTW